MFFFAGTVVVAELFAFVEELHAAGVIGFGFSRCHTSEIANAQVAFCDVEGREV